LCSLPVSYRILYALRKLERERRTTFVAIETNVEQ
jgi:hypothetical protein